MPNSDDGNGMNGDSLSCHLNFKLLAYLDIISKAP